MTTEQIEAMKALQVAYLEMREALTGREALATAAKKKGFGTPEKEALLLKQKAEMEARHAKADADYEARYGKKPSVREEKDLEEKALTAADIKQKEKVVKGMKKKLADFKDKYGDSAKGVMYAAATNIAKKMPDVNEETELDEAMSPVESAVHAHNYNIYAREKGTNKETGKQLSSMGKAIQPVAGKDIPEGEEPEGYYRDKESGKILKSETPEETITRKGQEDTALTKAMGYGKGRYQGD